MYLIKIFTYLIIVIFLSINNSFATCAGDVMDQGPRDAFSPEKATVMPGDEYRAGHPKTGMIVIPEGASTSGCNISSGSETGVESITACGKKVMWVDDVRRVKTDTTKFEIRVCGAQCFFGPIEQCYYIEQDTNDTYEFGTGKSKAWAKLLYFSGKEIGRNYISDVDDGNYAHRMGYVYNLHSGQCPYSENMPALSNKLSEKEKKTKEKETCLTYMRGGASKQITSEYYKGFPYNKTNNCYEMIKYDTLSCPKDSSYCVCDEESDCSVDTDYLPDKNSVKWKTMEMLRKSCFICWSEHRKKLDLCLDASFDKGYGFGPENANSKKFKELITRMKTSVSDTDKIAYYDFARSYGSGNYICAYEIFEFDIALVVGVTLASATNPWFAAAIGSIGAGIAGAQHVQSEDAGIQKQRVGCRKLPKKPGPWPFPRIAFPVPLNYTSTSSKPKYFTYMGAALWESSPSVRKFRDVSEYSYCKDKKSAELGEVERGDFYNPAIIVKYGENEEKLWFDPPNTTQFASKFLVDEDDKTYQDEILAKETKLGKSLTDAQKNKIRSKFSKWSTENPFILKYGNNVYNKDDPCYFEKIDSINAGICTRIEYEDDKNKSYFYAYKVVTNNSSLDTCKKHHENNELILIGGVDRPPLKYNYDEQIERTVTPFIVSEPFATDTAVQVLIRINPLINEYFIKSDGTRALFSDSSGNPTGAATSVGGISALVGILTSQVGSTLSGKMSYFENLQSGDRCGYILNHKICIGPFFNIDCSLLCPEKDFSIREDIRQGVIINEAQCNSDEQCKNQLSVFNVIKQQCFSFKRCTGSANLDDCSKTGLMQIKLTGDISDYQTNYDWKDAVCITQGLTPATFGSIGSTSLYGDYGKVDKKNDFVISYKGKSSGMQVAMRKNGNINETGPLNLISLNDDFYKYGDDDDRVRVIGEILESNNVLNKYFGNGCDKTCAKEKVTIRQKNMDELGLCITFDRRYTYEYGNNPYNAGSYYNLYVPQKCDYLEAQVLGPGGNAMQFKDNQRTAYKMRSVGQCIGMTLYCTFACPFLAIWGQCDVPGCFDNVKTTCERSLQSGSGGGGGYTHGIIDLLKANTDVLVVRPGSQNVAYSTSNSGCKNPEGIKIGNTFNPNVYTDIGEYTNQTGIGSATNQVSCAELSIDEGLKQEKNFTQDSVISNKVKFTNYFPNPDDVIYKSGIMIAQGGGNKMMDDTGADGGDGYFKSGDYLIQYGYSPISYQSKTMSCSAMIDKFTDQSPPPAVASQSDDLAEAIKNAPNYNAAALSCSTNRCCVMNGTNPDDASVCKYLSTTSNGSNCTGKDPNQTTVQKWICNEQSCSNTSSCICTTKYPNDPSRCQTYTCSNEKCQIKTGSGTWESNNCTSGGSSTVNGSGFSNYCCMNLQCESERAAVEDAKNNSTQDNGSQYTDDREKFKKDREAFEAARTNFLNKAENDFAKNLYLMCPTQIIGEGGAYDSPGVNDLSSGMDKVDGEGGGSVAMKVISAIANKCELKEKKNANGVGTGFYGYDDSCAMYKMTKGYCAIDCNETYCSSIGEQSGVNIELNPFKGSGGCYRDESPNSWSDSDPYSPNWDGDESYHGNDYDAQAPGGKGWVKLVSPYVKFSSTGLAPVLKNGKKVLDKINGMKDPDCSPRCPRAFVKMQNDLTCEYSSGNPGLGYETSPGTTTGPIKCVTNKYGVIVIPSSSHNRICLITKCTDFNKSYRFYGNCNENDRYTGELFTNGGAFYKELVSNEKYDKYCGSKDAILGGKNDPDVLEFQPFDYYLDDDILKGDFILTCDDHGNWRDKSGKIVTYQCPVGDGSVRKFYEPSYLGDYFYGTYANGKWHKASIAWTKDSSTIQDNDFQYKAGYNMNKDIQNKCNWIGLYKIGNP